MEVLRKSIKSRPLFAGIKFDVVPPREVAATENRTKCGAVAVELLLFDYIRNVFVDRSSGEENRLCVADCSPLRYTLCFSSGPFVSDHLVVGAGLCFARLDAGSCMDMQMEFGGVLCQSNKLRSARVLEHDRNAEY